MDNFHLFPIISVTTSRSTIISKEEYDQMVNNAFTELRREDGERIQFIGGREVTDIARLHACLLAQLPFAFLPPGTHPLELEPSWLLKHLKLNKKNQKNQKNCRSTSQDHICYVIRTSGSTGKQKVVAVPDSSIWSNIQDFIERFNVTKNDRILFLTSVLFDPSIIEIFLCIFTGATMVHVTDEIRSSPHLLSRVIHDFQPTFVQLTPALFKMLPFTLENKNMMQSVKILLIGGEKFPFSFVKQFRDSHFSQTRIFDVFGVTEVSCWATVYEVKPNCSQILFGEAIRDTVLRIDEEGAVFLEGPRICIVNGSRSMSYPTGDWVKRVGEEYVLQGRLDNVKKINGIKVNLEYCSEIVLSNVNEVEFAHFVVWKEDFLVLFVKYNPSSKNEDELIDLVKKYCPPNLPVTIIPINSFPITNNGKVDISALLSQIEIFMNGEWKTNRFWKILTACGLNQQTMDAILIDYGVNSFIAAELAILLGGDVTIREILSETTTVGQLVEKYLKNEEKIKNTSRYPTIIVSINKAPQLEVLWEHDMKKCIDGNPLIVRKNEEEYVVAVSHSGMIVCKNHTREFVCWEHTLSGQRFEASPAICEERIYIGSYNGYLWIFDLFTGKQLYKLFLPDSSIRGQVAVQLDAVFFITYKSSPTEASSGTLNIFRWRDKQLKEAPIAAGSTAVPQIINERMMVIVTTIRGTVEAFSFDSSNKIILHPLWKVATAKAIFSPVVVDQKSNIFISSADGFVSKCRLTDGASKGSSHLGEAIFSPVLIHQQMILVTTQKGSLFVLDQHSLDILRKLNFVNCSFVKSPSVYSEKIMFLMSKDGSLLKIQTDSLISDDFLCSSYKVSTKEVFVEPRFASNALIIGCRDDYLRAFRLSDLI